MTHGRATCCFSTIQGDPRAARHQLEARGALAFGELVEIQHIDAQLVLAFEANEPAALPDDLDPWTQRILATQRFGSLLVLLAWAHHHRGERELAHALLDVARDRLPECHIDDAHRRLAAWYRSVRP